MATPASGPNRIQFKQESSASSKKGSTSSARHPDADYTDWKVVRNNGGNVLTITVPNIKTKGSQNTHSWTFEVALKDPADAESELQHIVALVDHIRQETPKLSFKEAQHLLARGTKFRVGYTKKLTNEPLPGQTPKIDKDSENMSTVIVVIHPERNGGQPFILGASVPKSGFMEEMGWTQSFKKLLGQEDKSLAEGRHTMFEYSAEKMASIVHGHFYDLSRRTLKESSKNPDLKDETVAEMQAKGVETLKKMLPPINQTHTVKVLPAEKSVLGAVKVDNVTPSSSSLSADVKT